ncbi:MAG: imidazolonepropionase [Candidatus Bathyarchaeota archaeon]|nr:imidazolonepropionase [Candidatus Bathyarchaeota archaeon]
MTKKNIDLVIREANELVTIHGSSVGPLRKKEMLDLDIIEKGAVAIKDGKIEAVGKTSEIEQRYKSEAVIDANGKVVMPGFVDCHTHLVFAGSREKEFEERLKGCSYMEILAKGGGILSTVEETRKSSKAWLVSEAKKTLDIMLKHGTTTVEAKSGYGLTAADELKCLNVSKELDKNHVIEVVSTFLGAHAVPPEFRDKEEEYVTLLTEEIIPRVAENRLAEFCDVFCEKDVFSVPQARKVLVAGKECGLESKIHADELSDLGGAELAAEVKAISAEHLLCASDEGLSAMAKEGVIAVLLPTASFSLMTGKYADARKIIDMGIPIALGTDFNPSCWTENMQMAMAFACREMRLTPAEAIGAATINSAHSLARGQEIGSLEAGKRANVIVLDIPNHNFIGYRFGVNLVEKVVIDGEIVIDSRAQK